MDDRSTVRWIASIVVIALCLSVCQPADAQDGLSSTYGQEIFVGFMRDIGGGFFTQLRIIVGTPAATANFKVESSSEVVFEGTTTPDNPAVIDIPVKYLVTSNSHSDREKGLRVYTTDNEQIFVVVENFISFLNHGTYIAYPCEDYEELTEYEYYVMSVDDPSDTRSSQVLLIACDNDTNVTVVPTQSIILPDDTQSSLSIDHNVTAGATSHPLTLHKMQTLQISSVNDLSRTKITSNKPLVVISGHQCAAVPASSFGCEPFAVQVPFTATWGSRFLIAPFAGRDGPQILKAISSKQNTSFLFTCGTDSRGATDISVLIISIEEYCYLEASDPVFLTQMSFDGTIDSKGDPAITIISPVDQYINKINFVFLPPSDFPLSYVSITVLEEHYDPDSILFDDKVLNCSWHKIYNNSNDVVGYGCNMTLLNSESTHIQHTVSHSDPNGLLSVLVYGFSTFPTRGYAYLTGQELKISETGVEEIDFGDRDNLPMFDLTKIPGFRELDNTKVDGFSQPINIPNRLFFGSDYQSIVYVNENGVISFKEPWRFSHPIQFPTVNPFTRNMLAVAAFWSDNDIRKAGAVRYVSYSSTDRDDNPEGQNLLDQVNQYIQSKQDEDSETFEGNWVLAVHWDHVHPSPHGADDHNGISEDTLDKTNNYQAVIVTNTFQTFALFTHLCGEIQWSGVNLNEGAVVGFNAEGDYFQNHPLSGFSSIGEAISCTFDVKERQKRNMPGFQTNDPNIFPLDPNNPLLVIALGCACDQMYQDDMTLLENAFPDVINVEEIPNMLVNMFESCPSTEEHAQNDLGRYIKQPSDTISGVECYVTGKPIMIETLEITQQCCYSQASGSLMAQAEQRSTSGTLLIQHPIRNPQGYEDGDKMFRSNCCPNVDEVTGVNFDDFCNKFFRRRPIAMGANAPVYSPPVIGVGHGDPHYETFDSRRYDFNGMGDFVLMEALDEMGETSEFTLQGRLDMVSFWSVTAHKAIAFGQSGLTFHFGMGPGDGFRVFQTNFDEDVEITSELMNGEPWFDATGRAMLVKDGNNCHGSYPDAFNPLTASFYDSGIVLLACVYQRDSEHYINFRIQVPQKYSGRLRGFLGDYDGDSSNEFYRRGQTTPLVDTFDYGNDVLLNHLYTWEITNSVESLFYSSGAAGGLRKRQTEQESEFIPIFFEELTFTDEQRLVCQNSASCLFDLAVTNDMAFANNTLDQEIVANETTALLNNFPPNISGNATFQVTVGVLSMFYLTVEDEGDNLTFTVQGGLPNDAVLQEVDEGEFVFMWNLQRVTTEPLVFIAIDSSGASSTFAPTVEICACENGGNCTEEAILREDNTTNIIIKKCLCTEAFGGDFCDEDLNGCSQIECFEGVECLDIPAPGVGAVCGVCPSGYTGDGLKCYDIDECVLNDTLCDQICLNTDGGYICDCEEGYQITGTSQCKDIDECAGVNDCQQLCENTEGSYTCSCNEGFNLAGDGRNCTAKVLCENERGKCSGIALCAVVDDEETCYCPLGYTLISPGETECIDLNECALGSTICEHICINFEGSFDCSCRNGYELQENGHTCSDINECLAAALEFTDACEGDQNTQCVNTEGSFRCVCVPGYIRNNETCQRIPDEPPPPPPRVVTPISGIDNSLNYTTTAFTPETFTPEQQQLFRKVTAGVVVSFCSMTMCTLVLTDGKTTEIADLKIEPMNVAIPVDLIGMDDKEALVFTFYVQLPDGFLSKQDLQKAVEQGDEFYRNAFFPDTTTLPPTMPVSTTASPTTTELPTTTEITTHQTTTEAPDTTEPLPVTVSKRICYLPSDPGPCDASIRRYFFNAITGVCEEFTYGGCNGNENNFEKIEECTSFCNPNDCPPYCTPDYCEARKTRTALCTVSNDEEFDCDALCRITTCRVCYYDDEYRPLPDCDTCPTYPDVHQIKKCFNLWGTCVRRANGANYIKARGKNEKTRERFKCYEHPCN